ncbi:MAG: hypothetical protein FIA94_01205 [Nitrospirae bacterium]|nr:hypothetical protein [Nitrospirota bacterium]
MNEFNERDDSAQTVPRLKQQPKQGLLHKSPWLVLVFSLLITGLAWHVATDTVNVAKNAYFDFRVREAITRIVQRMQAYQQVLLGVQGLYKASVSVERHEFRSYIGSLHLADHYPGIQGVGFSLIVPAAAKNAHVGALRKEGFTAYDIRPEGHRELYTSIVYLEPFKDRNLRAFGYDMYSEPVRRAAMEDARDNDRMAMSGKVRLVQESGGEEQAGFLLYLPIYRNGLPHSTVAERRTNIIGWTYSPFRMNDLMQGIHGERASDLDIEIFDGKEATAGSLMYDSAQNHTAGPSLRSSLLSSTAIEIAGRPWTIHIRALQGLHSRVDSRRPELIAVAGLVISLLLTWLTWSLVTGREHAVAAVRERERLIAELQKAIAEIKTLEGILPICSVCKKIRDDKDAWNQMETFISEHSDAVFSHGYCPDCAKKVMEDIKKKP